eukprot:TRINITY_DN3243_c0_g1_i1.p1 TRINITY_DN3243_c0_g1~~TRINITY_DN3243_c0_g1_i1.p1  ORF type:complete len:365 (-),score=81.10 TRINITY_DN3243_c0_g1_i1:279-1373(-)
MSSMKDMRERLKKNLSISTKKPSVTAAGPGSFDTKTRKVFQVMTEQEFAARYKVGEMVMESTNTGMDVLFAKRIQDGMEVVIKVRDRSKSFKRSAEEREWRSTTECQLNMPGMPTMCQFIEIIETKQNYYVVMEKVEGKDLFETMAQDHITMENAREIIWQVLDALRGMHRAGRIHKDLKLENVMVDLDSPKRMAPTSPGGKRTMSSADTAPEVKLIDFDTVQDWEPSSPKTKDVLGTDGYIAPEAYGGDYSPASDIYCVGVIMYKLLTRKFPFRPEIFDDKPGENWVGSPAMKRIQERLRVTKIPFDCAPFDQCPLARDLCMRMLAHDCDARPTAEEAVKHKWFELSSAELSPPRQRSSQPSR